MDIRFVKVIQRKRLAVVFILCICVFSIFSQNVNASTSKFDEDIQKKLDTYLNDLKRYYHIPGMAVKVVSSSEELYSETFGECKNGDQMFFLGSESKSFTALAIMQLYEKGLVNLDDDIVKYLPDITLEKPVTVKQLLNQISGLGTYQNFKSMKVLKHYGTFQYANINYDLLGKIVEKVSGQSYGEYVNANIFEPIQMKQTTADLETAKKSDMVRGYKNYFGIPVPAKQVYPEEDSWFHVPAGYIASSSGDMGRYLQMYLNHGKTKDGKEILSSDGISKMFYDGVPMNEGDDLHYGMGWMKGKGYVCHAGRVENYSTVMMIFEESDIAISIQYNIDDTFTVVQSLRNDIPMDMLAIIQGHGDISVSPYDYLLTHIIVDICCLLLIGISVFLFKKAISYKGTTKKKSAQFAGIIILNIIFPTFILLMPRLLLNYPFWVIWSYANDVGWILIISATLAYLAGGIKSFYLIKNKHV